MLCARVFTHVIRERESCASSEYDEETQKEMEKRMNAWILAHRTFFDFLLMRICGKSKCFDDAKVEPNERALVCLF